MQVLGWRGVIQLTVQMLRAFPPSLQLQYKYRPAVGSCWEKSVEVA